MKYEWILAASIALSGMGCAKFDPKKVVTDAQLRTYELGGDAYSELTVDLKTGAITLPRMQLPLVDPRHPEKVYGEVKISSSGKGLAEVLLAVNMETIHSAFSLGAELPNGTELPISGINENQIVSLPIGNTKSRGYFAFDEGVALFGAAIVIRELDGVGQAIGDASLFPPMITFPHGIRGTVGVFTGKETLQSGFALFVDAGEALEELKSGVGTRAELAARASRKIRFKAIRPIRAEHEHAIGTELFLLHGRGARLSVH